MVGYFAFPTGAPTLSSTRVTLDGPAAMLPGVDASATSSDASEDRKRAERHKAYLQYVEETRRARLEREKEQIYLSELDWVRSGGMLRDDKGRTDKVRTEEFRKEIRLQEEEKQILERWNAYETRLRSLPSTADSFPIGWDTIPWPMLPPPTSPSDIEATAIAEFIFATFRVRGAKAIRKERLRTSILRWHPDKFAALLARVEGEDERNTILDGVNAVFRALRQLQDEEKQIS
jgi:hypothetical protein